DSETQLQISTVIDAYDDLIETNRRRIALLEESARLLYQEWFVKRRVPGYEHAKMVEGLPAGWSVQPLSALIDVNPKTPFEKDKSYPFVPMQSLSETFMLIGDCEVRIISGGAKFQNLDTLLARITPCLENGKTGFVQFLDDDAPVASGSTEFIVMRSRIVSPYWVYCLARDEAFRKHAIGSMAGADGRQRVNTKCFDTYLTLQPPEEVLLEFDRLMKPVFEEVEVLARMNKRLQEARDELLPKLMSGAITV
ncbi:MAG: restriction endonuclease subunit S, partial [Gallionellaceae bacterium]